MSNKEYRRLTRGRTRPGFAVAFGGRCSLWLGRDHLLRIDSSGYTESYRRFFLRDIQAVMMACENEDMFSAKGSLLSLLHEMSRAVAEVSGGVIYSGFNGMSEYEQDLSALGFPALMSYLAVRDFSGLYEQCQAFDKRLKEFLMEKSVGLNNFATLADLQEYLKAS